MIRAALLGLVTGLIVACGAAPSPAAQSCIVRYQGCAITAANMAEYVSCRDAVDKDCLPQKGAN